MSRIFRGAYVCCLLILLGIIITLVVIAIKQKTPAPEICLVNWCYTTGNQLNISLSYLDESVDLIYNSNGHIMSCYDLNLNWIDNNTIYCYWNDGNVDLEIQSFPVNAYYAGIIIVSVFFIALLIMMLCVFKTYLGDCFHICNMAESGRKQILMKITGIMFR